MTFLCFSFYYLGKHTKNFKLYGSFICFRGRGIKWWQAHRAIASTADLENSDQLPVKEVFEGIVMIVSQILS